MTVTLMIQKYPEIKTQEEFNRIYLSGATTTVLPTAANLRALFKQYKTTVRACKERISGKRGPQRVRR